jgi:hypothetical protein
MMNDPNKPHFHGCDWCGRSFPCIQRCDAPQISAPEIRLCIACKWGQKTVPLERQR